MLFIPVSRFLNLDAESYLNSNLNQILDSNPDQSDAVHYEGRKLQRNGFEPSLSVQGTYYTIWYGPYMASVTAYNVRIENHKIVLKSR